MNKRRTEYENGLERLYRFLECYFQEQCVVTQDELKTELQAIEGLKGIPIELLAYDPPVQDGEEYFYMVFEEFPRFDTISPETIYICIVPAAFDSNKEIDRFVSQKPILW